MTDDKTQGPIGDDRDSVSGGIVVPREPPLTPMLLCVKSFDSPLGVAYFKATPADLAAAGYLPVAWSHPGQTIIGTAELEQLRTQLAEATAKLRQFQRCADALEQLANGERVECIVSSLGEQTYECRAEEPCLACRVRKRWSEATAKLEAAEREAAAFREWHEANGPGANLGEGLK